jgi:sulfoxide reductase heme-binding subunit YedZ
VGFSAFVLLTPLALTSFNRAIQAVGAKRWRLLHRLVYAVAGLALLHFFWMRSGKNDFAEVFVYAVILAGLLCWRVDRFIKKKRL